MQPLISIIINSYNHEKYVGQAVASIIKQTYKNIEIIIVDDASIDASPEILRSYKKNYPQITRLELLEKNVGVGKAANLGMSFASGKYICFFSSDDRAHHDKIVKQVKYLEKNDQFAAVFTKAKYIDSNGLPLLIQREIFNIPIENLHWQLLNGNFLCAPSVMIRADVVKKLDGFNIAIRYLQDFDLWLRILKEYEIARIQEELIEYRIHGKNLSFFAEKRVPLATQYETVSCILNAINNWPLEKLFQFKKAKEAAINSKEKAKACAIISEHCLNLDMMYFGRPFLATDTAYRFALKGLLFDNDSVECQQVLNRVYEILGDKKRSETGHSIEFEKWKNYFQQLIPIENINSDQSPNSDQSSASSFESTGTKRDSEYSAWLTTKLWDTRRCRSLVERVEVPEILPRIHFLFTVKQGTQKQLADSVGDLAAQLLDNWMITAFSELAGPDSLLNSVEALEWVQIPSSTTITEAITSVVVASPAEWFICAPAGLRLSPAFTLIVGLRLRERSDSLLLYVDEDVIDTEGGHSQPKLKPDINIELLRSSPYIGAATLIHKLLMLDPRIAILPLGLARNYGAALLAIEQKRISVDHLDEILVYVPEVLTDEYAGTALGHLLVQQHLARCGVVAEIYDATPPGTLFIDYKLLDKQPMVSIIIPIQNRLDTIQSCLEVLLEKTDYPEFEVLVIDNGNIESTVQAFLANLSNSNLHVRVLSYSQKYNYSALNNITALQAQGEFLLLLNDDIMVLQENWLTRLVAIGLSEDVGVVGCRLVSLVQCVKHAGMIVGLGGSIDSIGTDLPLTEPGYMGRAQLAQDFSAVSGACMLIRKDLFLDVGGLDENNFANFYYDADLCLKVGERGYRIVWTPFVTLAQQDNAHLDVEQDVKQDKHDLSARRAFIKKWRHRLGNDPAYNRHLSLRQREWMIDGEFDVPWHPDFEPLPRIVAQPPDEMGVGQYRVIGPIKALTQGERICSFMLPALNSDKRFLPSIPELVRAKPTVLFLQNAFSDFHLDELQQYAELLPDIFRVFGQDDIVFSVPQKSSARKHFGKDTKARVRRAVSLCHRVIVTTEPIAEALRGMNDDIRVVPNYLEPSRWEGLQPPKNEWRKPRVGWAGAQQHDGDLEFILPVVEATANEVDWIFMGMCPPKLRYHVAETHPAVPFDQYPAALAALDLDLAIAPLELNRFNTAKSNLRLLEYGAVGYPVIATDILPYQNAPVTRVPNNPQAWIKAIREHVYELDAIRAEGKRLREWVLSNWMLDQHLDEWLRALLPD